MDREKPYMDGMEPHEQQGTTVLLSGVEINYLALSWGVMNVGSI